MVGSFQKEKKALPGESRNLCTFEKTQPNQCRDISIAVTSTQVLLARCYSVALGLF